MSTQQQEQQPAAETPEQQISRLHAEAAADYASNKAGRARLDRRWQQGGAR